MFNGTITRKNCDYSYFQLIPTKSNKNNQTEQLSLLVNKMFQTPLSYIQKEGKKIVINTAPKISFYISITKHVIKFYFMIPQFCTNEFKTICKEVWKNVEIKKIDCFPIPNNASKAQLKYKYDDALSISVDKRSNTLLNANMTISESLTNDEEVGIFYNFIPTSFKESKYFQMKTYTESVKKYQDGNSLKQAKNLKDYGIAAVKTGFNFTNDVVNELLGVKKSNKTSIFEKEISSSTKRKGSKELCKTQGILFSKANTTTRELELLNILGNTYRFIADDNEFVISRITKEIDIYRPVIPYVQINKTTIEENQNFLNLPSLEVIERFKMIEHNKVLELKAPSCLTSGKIRIGIVKSKENKQEVFYSMDKELRRLGRVLLGSMGSGKSYYLSNLAKDIIADNRGLVAIDYIDKCQLAEKIKAITPKNKLIEINFNDVNQLQSFNFNELCFQESDPIPHKINIAMQKAEQLQLLLDSINDDNSKLTPRMLRYFYSAATVAYYFNQNASFKQIVNLLKSCEERLALISSLTNEELKWLIEEVDDLKDLTKIDKNGKMENCDSKVDGILDRAAWLKTNMFTKTAFNKTAEDNLNFVELFKENKVILIKLPENAFKSRMIRNVIATFFLNKVWVSKQIDSSTHTEIFIDEIHQCFNCQLLMQNILVECRKFNLTPTLALHFLNQLTPKCKASVLESGSSFLLLQGCSTNAFNELKTFFEKDGYTAIDLSELSRYHALCAIKNEDTGYASFVVKLPS